MNPDSPLFEILTHALSALLGGGLAALVKARHKHRQTTLDQYNALNAALRDENLTLRQENEALEETLWELGQGILALQAQLRAAGLDPEFAIDTQLLKGVTRHQ